MDIERDTDRLTSLLEDVLHAIKVCVCVWLSVHWLMKETKKPMPYIILVCQKRYSYNV